MRNIKEIREAFNLSYVDLSQLLACNPTSIAKWQKSGKVSDGPSRILSLMDRLMTKYPESCVAMGEGIRETMRVDGGLVGGVGKLLEYRKHSMQGNTSTGSGSGSGSGSNVKPHKNQDCAPHGEKVWL